MEYQSGFANHFETEALQGSLPQGQNSPKVPLKGLVPEQLTGSAFTMDRAQNLRSWLYRIRPATLHEPYEAYSQTSWKTQVESPHLSNPGQMRWQPMEKPQSDCDFVDGIVTMVATAEKPGCAVHHYGFNKNMDSKFFYNADGELLIIPEKGSLKVRTEMGDLEVEPQEIVIIPRGIKFQVLSQGNDWCRGYVGENTGHPFILPNLGPLGANALAIPRDFKYPVATYENKEGEYEVVAKFNHGFWKYRQGHSPLDVVAWHGNYAPYKYDLRKFNTMGTVSYDHPDPSIYTVLTSPSAIPGQANIDFVIFPPRWLVGENTFKPPYYHRNIMSEYMGLIHGDYDAKKGGFVPGGSSLHNRMSAHGPDTNVFNTAIQATEEPYKVKDTMAFMFETCHIYHPTESALKSSTLEKDYWKCWQGFKPLFKD